MYIPIIHLGLGKCPLSGSSDSDVNQMGARISFLPDPSMSLSDGEGHDTTSVP